MNFMLFTGLISAAQAATIQVGSAAEYTSITAAIEASTDGDRIEVAAGTYNETIRFRGKAVTVISLEGPSETLIVGTESHTLVLDQDETESSVISGFTVRGPSGLSCIYVEGSSPILEDLIVEGCGSSTGVSGGGIEIDSAAPTIRLSDFRNNRAEQGGAAYVGPGSSATFESCSFGGNQAQTGGSLAATDAEVFIEDSDFSGDTAESGGAIAATDTMVSISNSRFNANEARFGFAGAILSVQSDLSLYDTRFEANLSTYDGGSIHSDRGTLTVDACQFTDNRAAFGSGGAVNASNNSTATTTNTAFEENRAAYDGGAFSGSNVSSVHFLDTNFSNNGVEVHGQGGAIFVEYSGLSMENGVLSANTATQGGGVAAAGSDISIFGSEFERNSSTTSGAGVHVHGGSLDVQTARFTENHAYEHAGSIYSSAIETTVNESVFVGNQSTGGDGGALYFSGTEASVVATSLFGNWARTGGAIYVTRSETETDATLHLQLSTIQENEGLYEAGGLFSAGPVQIFIHNNTFIGNESLSSSSAANIRIESTESDVRNNIVAWGVNGSGLSFSESAARTTTVRHNNVFGNLEDYTGFDPATGTGNISLDPLLVDVSFDAVFDNDDLSLRLGSPCLGTADPDFTSLSLDIGAFGASLSMPTDEDGDGYSPDLDEDCDDRNASIHIDAEEICWDEVDNDCNGDIDEDCEPYDTGTTNDTGTGVAEDTGILSEDSGSDAPQDTGADPSEDTESWSDDIGRDDTAIPALEETDLYPLNGKGCACSSTTQPLSALWWSVVPLILIRRRNP